MNSSNGEQPEETLTDALLGPARDGDTGQLPAITYGDLAPDTLEHEWEDTHPPPAGDVGHFTDQPVWDQQVLMAVGILADLTERGRDPQEAVRRAAVALMHDPGKPGTPLRCANCPRIYLTGDGPCDWRMAGRTDGMCWECMLAAPRHAPKPAPPKAPAPPKTAATRARRPSARRKAAINGQDKP
jgi:hypothetical protein